MMTPEQVNLMLEETRQILIDNCNHNDKIDGNSPFKGIDDFEMDGKVYYLSGCWCERIRSWEVLTGKRFLA